MKLLIDHGSSYNLGDAGMLEGVVSALRSVLPYVDLHVADRSGVRTCIWNWPGVHKVAFGVRPEFARSGRLDSTTFLWRYSKHLRKWEVAISFALLGRVLKPSSFFQNSTKQVEVAPTACEYQYDGLHVVGGGNLTDQFPEELWQRCCLIQAFALRNKPVVLTGQQLGPFRGQASRNCLLRTLRQASFVGLREPTLSVDLCKQAALPSQCYGVMGDDSFGLEPCATGDADRTLERIGLAPFGFVAVNLRVAPYAAAHGEYLSKIALMLRSLYASLRLPLFVIPIALNSSDSDVESGRRLAAQCEGTPLIVFDEPDPTPALIKGLLGRAYGAVGVSYHFCTFALSQGVPAICLYDGAYYAQKGEGLRKFWGDERVAISLASAEPQATSKAVTDLWEDTRFRQQLAVRAENACFRWREVFQSVVTRTFGKAATDRVEAISCE